MAIQGFDKNFYLNAKLAQLQSNPETAADWAGKDAAFLEARLENGFGLSAEAHYEQYGYQEGLAPNAFFNSAEYIRAKATEMFNDSETAYLTIDAAAEDFVNLWGGNVYNHYLQYGESENINPSNDFDVSSYLEAKLAQLQAEGNTEITTTEGVAEAFEASGLTALTHFLAYGEEEGLSATAVPEDEQVEVEEEATNPGEVFSLTQGLDTINGTSGDDTFNAYAFNGVTGADVTTLNSVDTIDGGAGRDTLNIEVKANGVTEDFNGAIQGTIQNVEVININNTQANSAADVDASNFEGAEEVWQIGAAGAVTELGADTTAGFRNIATGTLSVTAANAAAAASVALDGVGDAAALDVVGTATGSLNSVTVSGSRVDTANNGLANLALGVTAGQDQETVSVDSAFDTVLTVTNGAGQTVKTVDATASEGDIAYTGAANTVSTIKTGTGNDTVTIATATSNTTGAVVNALVETGEGNDQITVNTSGTGKTTVNAGAGDDTITLTSALKTSTRIDGGEGTDKVVLPNGGNLVAGDYALISSTVSNVEALEFGATVVADASKLSQFDELTFDELQNAGSVIDNVAAEQSLVAKGNLTAEAAGYVAAAVAAPATYAGTLNVTAQAAATPVAQAIDVSAEAANVTVAAASGVTGAVAASQAATEIATITGDVQTLNVVTENGVNNADLDAAAAADTLSVVDITVGTELAELAELTLSGNGSVTVDNANGANANAATKLATIDASELGGELAYGANAGDITGGLNYTGNIAVAESVTLGSGADVVTANSTYGLMDSITGFDSTKETNDDTSVTDQLIFATLNTASATAAKVTLSEDATSLELAFVEAAAASGSSANDTAGSVVTFQFDGNTYLFQDAAGTAGDASDQGTLEDGDLAIEIVGTHDFSQDFDTFAA